MSFKRKRKISEIMKRKSNPLTKKNKKKKPKTEIETERETMTKTNLRPKESQKKRINKKESRFQGLETNPKWKRAAHFRSQTQSLGKASRKRIKKTKRIRKTKRKKTNPRKGIDLKRDRRKKTKRSKKKRKKTSKKKKIRKNIKSARNKRWRRKYNSHRHHLNSNRTVKTIKNQIIYHFTSFSSLFCLKKRTVKRWVWLKFSSSRLLKL